MEESPLSTGEVLEPGSLVRAVELRSAEQRKYAERRILLLEDNDAFRSTTAEILVQEGYTVVAAATGQAALRQLRTT
jgi:PleD family two-component response regulator